MGCITFVTINKHSPHSEFVVLQDGHSLVSASRTGEEATVASLLDSGADPHFRDIVRKNQEFGARDSIHSVLGIQHVKHCRKLQERFQAARKLVCKATLLLHIHVYYRIAPNFRGAKFSRIGSF